MGGFVSDAEKNVIRTSIYLTFHGYLIKILYLHLKVLFLRSDHTSHCSHLKYCKSMRSLRLYDDIINTVI